MKLVSGYLGGRRIETPKGYATHPMGERIRGALFNKLGELDGLTVLDAFAGSGALSFEAVSRGAEHVTAIDKDFQALKVLSANARELDVEDRVKAIRANCAAWSENNPDAQFDVVIADPPYNNFQIKQIEKLVKHLKPNGLMVISYPGKESTPTVNGVVVVDKSNYGDAALAFYRLETSD